MKKSLKKNLGLVLAAALCACGLQACYVDDNCIERYNTACSYDCVDLCEPRAVCELRPVCDYETMCDLFSCWDEYTCWDEEYCWNESYCFTDCAEHCHDYLVCEKPPQCYNDYDCGVGSVCRGGKCMGTGPISGPGNGGPGNGGPGNGGPGNNGNNGTVAMCGACNSWADCAENNSECVLLDDNSQVCTRACSSDNDCANGFYCGSIDGGHSGSKQCLPYNGSCDANYCSKDADCMGENATCDTKSHSCTLSKKNLNECETYADCKGSTNSNGEELNVCVQYSNTDKTSANYCTIDCYSDRGCDAGYYCYLTKADLESGVCFRDQSLACRADSDCSEKGMICNNGKCTLSCSTNDDCSSPSKRFSCIQGACVFQD